MLASPAVLLQSPGAVVGISSGGAQHEVLVTLRSQGFSLFDARTQTELQSWRTRAGTQLTHAACLHSASGHIIW